MEHVDSFNSDTNEVIELVHDKIQLLDWCVQKKNTSCLMVYVSAKGVIIAKYDDTIQN